MSKIYTVGETYKSLRIAPKLRSTRAAMPGFSGATATFTLFDKDKTTKLLDAVPAVVELNVDNSLAAVRFDWTTAHWATIQSAKGSSIAGQGYGGRFTITPASGAPLNLPEQSGLLFVPIQILAA